jgi:DNA (cytosine-5)-methyltransferase 1
MIRIADDRMRQIRLTGGNVRNSHIPVTRLRELLPSDCFGASKKRNGAGKPVIIHLDGLNITVETDVGRDAKTGRPRSHFRERGWIRKFFEHHGVRAGDMLEVERLGDREYRLRIVNREEASVIDSRPPIRVAEFFAGIGLVRLALDKHGFKTVFANDIDPDKYEIYQDNFPPDDFNLGDIHLLKPDGIPECDLATASFPCTDLSIAGEMNGIHHGESSAFWGFMKLLENLGHRRPRMVLLENVPGFLMSRDGKDFESALVALNELGYVCDSFFVDASRFVPQSRLRLFVVGKLGAPSQFPFGLSTTQTRPEPLVDFIMAHPQIQWDVRPLPDLPQRSTTLADILEDLPDNDPAWWNKERAEYCFNQLSDRHLAVARKMLDQNFYSYGTAFRRIRKGRSMAELRTDGLAGCLRTPRGGSGRQILFKAGKGRYQVRLLTARECARLQGVPDSYQITVPLNQALFGFGDAVCVPVIEWIAQNYLLPCLAEPAVAMHAV